MMPVMGGMPAAGMFGQSGQNLTATQAQELEDVLSRYDAGNLSDKDTTALVEQITELGILPGRGLADA